MLLVPTLLKAEMSLHRDHLERESIKNNHINASDMQHDLCQTPDASENQKMMPQNNTPIIPGEKYEFSTPKCGSDDVWTSGLSGTSRALRGDERWVSFVFLLK